MFGTITGTEFITTDNSALLTLEYLSNFSGSKIQSRFLNSQTDDNDELSSASVAVIGAYLSSRFSPKWNALWADYVSTLSLFDNVNLEQKTTYGKSISKAGSDTLTKAGSEKETVMLDETKTEAYDSNNPFKTSRSITGKYTDVKNETATRTGTEETLESFPESRVSSKITTGSYSDTDTITNTRTGSQIVTDKGATTASVFGFNSSVAVPSSKSEPSDPNGLTSETTYGQNGLVDAHTGAITRSYDEDGLIESTTESGQRKLATSYGQDGLQDSLSSGTTRSYDNYKDETTESGSKTLSTSYGQNGKTSELQFTNRTDTHATTDTETHSGNDTIKTTGMNLRRLTDKYDILQLLYSNDVIHKFFELVFADIDSVLALPVFE